MGRGSCSYAKTNKMHFEILKPMKKKGTTNVTVYKCDVLEELLVTCIMSSTKRKATNLSPMRYGVRVFTTIANISFRGRSPASGFVLPRPTGSLKWSQTPRLEDCAYILLNNPLVESASSPIGLYEGNKGRPQETG